MCGIVGYVGHRDAVPILMDGLRRLEYRGYDSAGVAVLDAAGRIDVRKRDGKLAQLETLVRSAPPHGRLGVGHTRWATHGAPTTPNAHPHLDAEGHVAVVHNGIIENYAELRAELAERGHVFASETDTEVIAHLISDGLDQGRAAGAGTLPGADETDPGARADVAGETASRGPATAEDPFVAAVRWALARLEGSFAVAAFSDARPDLLVAARRFSPLVVGLGDGQSYLASDIPALLAQTRRVVPLEDDEVAVLGPEGVRITNLDGLLVERPVLDVTWDAAAAEKGGYEHYVRKEIDEQPRALADTLRGRLVGEAVALPELDVLALDSITRTVLVAAGTSLYAGLVGKLQLERWARLPAELATASELRYGDPVLGPDTLVVVITQSGETADTLAAARGARGAGAPTLAITNVVGSSITRVVDATLQLQVGPEVGVVATKTFTGELVVLALLAAALGRRRGTLDGPALADIVHALRGVPEAVARAIDTEPQVAAIARELADRRSMFFIGRRFGHPVALEGALKLKEISYVHAEGYPAGELKHGPIAMLDPSIPLLAIATASPTYPKLISNIEEVRARGVEVVAVASEGDTRIAAHAEHVIHVPRMREEFSPLVDVVPTQLFAYHVAVALGRDVDQPRNLAKSVTVE